MSSSLTGQMRTAIRLARGRAPVAAFGRSISSQGIARLAVSSSSSSSTSLSTLPKALSLRSRLNSSSIPRCFSSSAVSWEAAPAAVESVAEEDLLASATQENGDAMQLFASLRDKVHPFTLRAVTQKPFNYERMSDVQKEVLHLLPELADQRSPMPDGKGRDLLVKAKTGTGKTLAFLIPAIEARANAIKEVSKANYSKAWIDLLKRNRPELELGENPAETLDASELKTITRQYINNTVGTLILSPTRELATQIATEAQKLCTNHKQMNVHLLVGGASRGLQISKWKSSTPDIVVATPGRVLDMLRDVAVIREAMSSCQTLILDEADTLLEMGFKEEMKSIIDFLPEAGQDRHTMLFSATVSPEIRQIAKASLAKGHRFIDCVPAGEENTHKHIPQFSTVLPDASLQIPYILSLIAHDQIVNAGKSKVIVFTPTTRMTQLLANIVLSMKRHLPVGAGSRIYEIHSKKEQSARFRVSSGFRSDKSGGSVLITSDVSARGVDYPGTTRVIQVGIPGNKDQYIHRIGRTGRAGASGRGDIVLMPFEEPFLDFELDDLNVKPVDVSTITKELAELAEQYDADPSSIIPPEVFKQLERAARSPMRRQGGVAANFSDAAQPIRGPLAEKISFDSYRSKVEELVSGLDEQDIRETFMSQLGFYVGRTAELRTSKTTIFEGLKPWAREAGGLEQDVTLSPKFASTLGISSRDGSRGRQGGRGGYGGGGGRGGFRKPSFDRDSRGSFGDRDRSSFGGRNREMRGSSFGDREPRSFGDRDTERFGNRREGGGSFRRDRSDPLNDRYSSGKKFGAREDAY